MSRTRCSSKNVFHSHSGALGDKKEESEGPKEIDPEVEEALREAEARRVEKHRKMGEERETMRQDIRDKVSDVLVFTTAFSLPVAFQSGSTLW